MKPISTLSPIAKALLLSLANHGGVATPALLEHRFTQLTKLIPGAELITFSSTLAELIETGFVTKFVTFSVTPTDADLIALEIERAIDMAVLPAVQIPALPVGGFGYKITRAGCTALFTPTARVGRRRYLHGMLERGLLRYAIAATTECPFMETRDDLINVYKTVLNPGVSLSVRIGTLADITHDPVSGRYVAYHVIDPELPAKQAVADILQRFGQMPALAHRIVVPPWSAISVLAEANRQLQLKAKKQRKTGTPVVTIAYLNALHPSLQFATARSGESLVERYRKLELDATTAHAALPLTEQVQTKGIDLAKKMKQFRLLRESITDPQPIKSDTEIQVVWHNCFTKD